MLGTEQGFTLRNCLKSGEGPMVKVYIKSNDEPEEWLPYASSHCYICGVDTPHKHNAAEVISAQADWLVANASRFHFTDQQIIDAGVPEVVTPAWYRWLYLSAIYFLIKDGKFVYVGQSTCLSKRITRHRVTGKDFDSLSWFEAPEIFLTELEGYYIDRCEPILNHKSNWHGDFTESVRHLDHMETA